MNTFPITPSDVSRLHDAQHLHTAHVLTSYVAYPSDDAYDDVTCSLDVSRLLVDLVYDTPMLDALRIMTEFLYTPADHLDDYRSYPPYFSVLDANASDSLCDELAEIRDVLFPLD